MEETISSGSVDRKSLLDSIVASAFIGLTAVAVYGNYFYIVSSLISFIGGCIASATASIVNSIVTENANKNYDTFKKIILRKQRK